MNLLLRVAPAAIWMLAIFELSSRSTIPQTPSLPSEITAMAGHLIAYAILAALVYFGLGAIFGDARRCSIWAFGISVGYGISDEFHQSFVPGRHASPLDVMADAIGAVLGLCLLYLAIKHREQRRAEA